MKQIPKYDRNEVDPLSLKPALSQLYKNTLTEEWMGSQFKDRIIIGFHNIKCSGAILQSRYRETWSGKFDGIYTQTVLNIFKTGKINKIIVCCFYCPPWSKKKSALIEHMTLTVQSLLNIYPKTGILISGDGNDLKIDKLLSVDKSLKLLVTNPTRGQNKLGLNWAKLSSSWDLTSLQLVYIE